MRVSLTLIFLFFISLIKGQNKVVLQPILEYKQHTNKTAQYSFYANNLTWQVLPNNFLESNVLNYGLKAGYLSKYFGAYLGLILDNNRLNNQLKIVEDNNLIALYNFDKTFRYLRISNQFDFFILGRDTVKKSKKIYSQLIFNIGGDLSLPSYKKVEFEEKNFQTSNYKFNFENTYGGSFAKQLFVSIGLTYKIINRKNINVFNVGLSYRFTQRNFRGISSNLKVTQTDLNNTVNTYSFNWSASHSGIYVTISTDLGFNL